MLRENGVDLGPGDRPESNIAEIERNLEVHIIRRSSGARSSRG